MKYIASYDSSDEDLRIASWVCSGDPEFDDGIIFAAVEYWRITEEKIKLLDGTYVFNRANAETDSSGILTRKYQKP